MKKVFKNILASICLAVFLLSPFLVWAGSSATDSLVNVGTGFGNAPYATADRDKLAEIIGIVIQAFLGLLGVLFLVYMLYAGYNWMIAQGDEERVTRAKDTIQRAIIGLIVIIGAYAISYWVFDRLLKSSTGVLN
jgi:hypothetical protein